MDEPYTQESKQAITYLLRDCLHRRCMLCNRHRPWQQEWDRFSCLCESCLATGQFRELSAERDPFPARFGVKRPRGRRQALGLVSFHCQCCGTDYFYVKDYWYHVLYEMDDDRWTENGQHWPERMTGRRARICEGCWHYGVRPRW